MTMRCAVLDDYQNVAAEMADWSSVADRVEMFSITEHLDEDELVDRIGDCEIVVAMRERTPLTARLFERLPRLRLVVTTGARNASINLDAAASHGVVVCGTDSLTHPTVELTWALILAAVRHVTTENAAIRSSGPWQSTVGADLAGARLGILGLGRIGLRVAEIGKAFGMDVVAWSPNLTDERCVEAGVTRAATKLDVMATSDIVTIHLVLSERTAGIVGAAELAAMKPSAYLVNTSRAGLVDQSAFVAALEERRIAGAAVDVFETEPLPADDRMRSVPNLTATPHLGYVTRRNYAEKFFPGAVEDIAAFLDGSPVRVLA